MTADLARLTASVSPFGSNAMRPFSFASVRSCSVAAGRWTSAGTRSTCLRNDVFRWSASLAAVVVFPDPWRPTSRITEGRFLRASGRLFAPEDPRQLVPDDLDDLLGRRERREDFLPDRLFPHAGREVLDDLEVHVRLEEGRPDLFQGLVDVKLGEVTLAAEFLEDALESV